MISEETLVAFADGELDAAARDAVEVAMRDDPEVARRVARHRALRSRLQSAFAEQLSEPVPQRFLSLVGDSSAGRAGNVVDLNQAREASLRRAQSLTKDAPSWRQVGAIAAGVLLGLGIGYGMWRQGSSPIVLGASGALFANGKLAGALSSQLTAEQAGASAVRMGVSYLAKSGEYCRTFVVATAEAASSGVACKDHEQWQIQALARVSPEDGHAYRTAATAVAPVILKVVEEQIQGETLDAAGELAARRRGWQRLP